MSLVSCVGGEGNLLEETPKQCRMLELPHPFLSNDDMARLRRNILGDFRTCTLRMSFPVAECTTPERAGRALRQALDELCKEAVDGIDGGASIAHPQRPRHLRRARADPEPAGDGGRAPSPHPQRTSRARRPRRRDRRAARGLAHVPAHRLRRGRGQSVPRARHRARRRSRRAPNYIKALKKGLLKTMSKMGISAVPSYQGAQIFEAVGIDQMVIDNYFTGTVVARARRRPAGDRRRDAGAPSRARSAARAGATSSTSAASTSGAPPARRTCGARRRWRSCKRRCASRTPPATTSTRASSTISRARLDDAARDVGPAAGRARGRRSRTSSRRRRSSSASRPARCRSARSPKRRTRTSPSR